MNWNGLAPPPPNYIHANEELWDNSFIYKITLQQEYCRKVLVGLIYGSPEVLAQLFPTGFP